MDTIRLNITLPKEIATKLDLLVGAKSKSSFIISRIGQIYAQDMTNAEMAMKIPLEMR